VWSRVAGSASAIPVVPPRLSLSAHELCLHIIVGTRQRPLFDGSMLAWEPLTCPTCRLQRGGDDFLRSAAHECVLRVLYRSGLSPAPNRCWPLLSYFFRSARASVIYLSSHNNTSQGGESQREQRPERCDFYTFYLSILWEERLRPLQPRFPGLVAGSA